MPHLKEVCSKPTKYLQEACTNAASGASDRLESFRITNSSLLQVLTNEDVIQQLKKREDQKSSNAMFKSMMNYLRHVETILLFVEASRNANLALHLEAGEALSKLFFALDQTKYKCLWTRYITDMQEMKTKYPATWQELEDGNISVTKSEIPFVSIGADHACEHLNRMLKVHSVLVGISNNANARQRCNYEFTLTPRALFAPYGSMLPCTDKSKLIHNLEKLTNTDETNQHRENPAASEQDNDTDCVLSSAASPKIAVVDGMVLVQKMTGKKGALSTVKDLAHSFNDRLTSLTAGFSQVIVVFDTYKPDSLKAKTRERRRQGKAPVQYQITDDTNIQHISLTRFLSHKKTKADRTDYLAKATLNFNKDSPRLVITSASGHTKSNKSLQFEDNNHEESDTLMICLAA